MTLERAINIDLPLAEKAKLGNAGSLKNTPCQSLCLNLHKSAENVLVSVAILICSPRHYGGTKLMPLNQRDKIKRSITF